MNITAKMVKELRDRTGAGMMECKKALTETNGDMEAAVIWLRENSDVKADKKAGRVATEGTIAAEVSADSKTAAMIEVNIETDFAARNENFKDYVAKLSKQALVSPAQDVDAFLDEPYITDPTITIGESVREMIASIGENMMVRRYVKYEAGNNGLIHAYIHGIGNVGVLIEVKTGNEESVERAEVKDLAKNLAMQIAAMNPRWLRPDDVDAAVVEQEREVLRTVTLNEGRPENIVDKIVDGRIGRFFRDNTLLEQDYVRDDKMSVSDYITSVGKSISDDIEIVRYTRFELGEGVERVEEDFAAEVMSQIK